MTGQEILQEKHVLQAIQILYPFTYSGRNDSPKETLKALTVFDYRMVDALLQTGIKEDVYRLIDETAKEVIRFSTVLGADKKHQLNWGENKKKMADAIEKEFPFWFKKAKEVNRLEALVRNFSNRIASQAKESERITNALLSTEKEAKELKGKIGDKFAELLTEIQSSELKAHQKMQLVVEVSENVVKSYQFVDAKLAETPVRVYYYKSGSRVQVKVNLNKSSHKYTVGRGRSLRVNRGEDSKEYPIIVSVDYLEDFLYTNDVRDADIVVDKRSVDSFYLLDSGKQSINLTPAFVAEWYNYDCPYLYRITPNKERGTNMLGMPIPHFSNRLVESSWSAVYIDETITEKEAKALTKGHERGAIAEEIRSVYLARKAKESGEIEKIEEWVKAYDARIQEVINRHSAEIIQGIKQAFPTRILQSTGTDAGAFAMNDDFGLDCGFLNISVSDKEYEEKRGILKNVKSESQYANLSMPYGTQSTTVQMNQFETVKIFVQRELGIVLYGRTLLD